MFSFYFVKCNANKSLITEWGCFVFPFGQMFFGKTRIHLFSSKLCVNNRRGFGSFIFIDVTRLEGKLCILTIFTPLERIDLVSYFTRVCINTYFCTTINRLCTSRTTLDIGGIIF